MYILNMINLEDLDFEKKTQLCEIMNKYGSDKGNGWHNYTIVYNKIFEEIRNNPLNLFEVGLGTNNLDVPSNMGINGKPGASLKGWKEFFPNSNIFGADIDTRILFEEERIKTFYTNQLDGIVIKEMWEKIPENFDIILDDGLHNYEANINFYENSIHKLKKDGIYIIEDIVKSSIYKYEYYFLEKNISNQILYIINPENNHDNNIIIIKK